jgi:hypothetical protein
VASRIRIVSTLTNSGAILQESDAGRNHHSSDSPTEHARSEAVRGYPAARERAYDPAADEPLSGR